VLGSHDPPPAEGVGGAGIGAQVHALALRAYDQMIGLELGDVAVDGCITKAPCGNLLDGDEIRLTDHCRVRGLRGDDPAAGQVPPLHLPVAQAGVGRVDQVVVAAGLGTPSARPGCPRLPAPNVTPQSSAHLPSRHW
jgi:hypothetical protein